MTEYNYVIPLECVKYQHTKSNILFSLQQAQVLAAIPTQDMKTMRDD
jgi:hypothetical protein